VLLPSTLLDTLLFLCALGPFIAPRRWARTCCLFLVLPLLLLSVLLLLLLLVGLTLLLSMLLFGLGCYLLRNPSGHSRSTRRRLKLAIE
jgi:hypothetical protein